MGEGRRFKRALITGAGGSGGSYLAEYIAEHQPEVELHGMARWHSTTQGNLFRLKGQIQVHEVDLLDMSSVLTCLREVRPDAIFHLASHANVRACWTTPASVLNNNIIGTSNLLEGIRLLDLDPWIQLCSTSEVYGQVKPEEIPITEQNALRPTSPYAVSKVAQDMLGWTYFNAYGLKVIRTRMFAYINPRRADLFATAFTRQVARIEAGLQDELVHGNLDSVRTLIDVRDAMRAYWDALVWCEPGEVYNIGGTTTMKVGEFLERLIALCERPIPHRVDPALLRPADVTLQIPDCSKFASVTDWKPEYSFDESVQFILDHWRERVRRDPNA